MNLVKNKINSIKNTNLTKKGLLQIGGNFAIYLLTKDIKYKRISIRQIANDGEEIEIFESVGILNGSVEDNIKVMEHPIENGEEVADHTINTPVIIKLTMLFDINDKKNKDLLINLYQNRLLLSAKISNEVYENLIISQKPYEVKNDMYDKDTYNITLQQVLIANTQFLALPVKKVKNSKNSSLNSVGNKQVKERDKTILKKMVDKII